MNKKQIAFITCVNDETEYAECRHYLDRLHVPEGYGTDIISIEEAPSMAAGYNAGMKCSDAKYKVYLHQDVFIKNTRFISELIKLFTCNEQIGMMGVIGKRKLGTAALDMMKWDTGKVIYDYEILNWDSPENTDFTEVAAIDGLLMATQYDLPWREDIFTGWDFYDFSQCMEFKKAGYKTVVPQQKEIWCCHDGLTSNLTAYFDYYELFLAEYGEAEGISGNRSPEELLSCTANKKYAQEMLKLKEELKKLFDMGAKEELRIFFRNADFQGNPHLREYESIVQIDQAEEQHQSSLRFWNPDMSASQLVSKLQKLKRAMKRIEYGASNSEDIRVLSTYSKYAVMMFSRL